MARLPYNNAYGTLVTSGTDVTNSTVATVINFQTAPNFATLTGGDYIVLVLDAGNQSKCEIVWLTAYTAGATTGTVTRQAEDASRWPAVAHPSGTWGCDWTAYDPSLLAQATDLTARSLIPTAVKTANYTAVAGDFVMCDATSGPFTVTAPALAAGVRWGARLTTSVANAVTLSTGSGTFDSNGTGTLVLASGPGTALVDVTFAGNAAGTQWVATTAGKPNAYLATLFPAAGVDVSAGGAVQKVQGVAITSAEATLLSQMNNAVARNTSTLPATVLPGEQTVLTGSTPSGTMTLPGSTSQTSTTNIILNLSSVSVVVAAGSGTTINFSGTVGSVSLPPRGNVTLVLIGTVWYAFENSVNQSGLVVNIPVSVGSGSIYYATDDAGGTPYMDTTSGWQQMGTRGLVASLTTALPVSLTTTLSNVQQLQTLVFGVQRPIRVDLSGEVQCSVGTATLTMGIYLDYNPVILQAIPSSGAGKNVSVSQSIVLQLTNGVHTISTYGQISSGTAVIQGSSASGSTTNCATLIVSEV